MNDKIQLPEIELVCEISLPVGWQQTLPDIVSSNRYEIVNEVLKGAPVCAPVGHSHIIRLGWYAPPSRMNIIEVSNRLDQSIQLADIWDLDMVVNYAEEQVQSVVGSRPGGKIIAAGTKLGVGSLVISPSVCRSRSGLIMGISYLNLPFQESDRLLVKMQ